jgi:hypothetical protein
MQILTNISSTKETFLTFKTSLGISSRLDANHKKINYNNSNNNNNFINYSYKLKSFKIRFRNVPQWRTPSIKP